MTLLMRIYSKIWFPQNLFMQNPEDSQNLFETDLQFVLKLYAKSSKQYAVNQRVDILDTAFRRTWVVEQYSWRCI